MEIAGAFLICLVAIQLSLYVYSSVQQVRGDRTHREMEQALLTSQIEAANARRIQQEQSRASWNGYRKFVVDRIVDEAERVRSFYLKPHDHKPLPEFQPGQYLTFRLEVPGQPKPVIRCYSLSECANSDFYRVTIKRAVAPPDQPDAPPGLISSFFHDAIREDQILDVQAPRGHFKLDPSDQRPAVLIAGGVGITPMYCMARAVAEADSNREIHLFYGVRHGGEHALAEALAKLAEQNDNIRVYNVYSHPRNELDVEHRDYQYQGHITLELMKKVLGSSNYEFYLCGPPPMMSALIDALKKWGVPKSDILTEAFGASTVKKAFPKKETSEGESSEKPEQQAPKGCTVSFSRSGKSCSWDGSHPNLLDFLTDNGVNVDSGCRAGNCATCLVAIKSGRVAYLTDCGAEPEEGSCLTCIAVPEEDLTLDV